MSVPEIYPPGARHGWIEHLCDRLEQVAWGQDADRLLADPEAIPDSAGLFRLPVWLWVTPTIDVGRKGRTRGGTLLLPVRIVRPESFLRVVPAGGQALDLWGASGMGVAESGQVTMQALGPATPHHMEVDPRSTQLRGQPLIRANLYRQLEKISARGRHARWEVLLGLEPYVKSAVNSAHGYVCTELAGKGNNSRPVLDRVALENITDRMLVGEENVKNGDAQAPSAVSRMLDRCLSTTAFQRVDPQRYVKITLRRDAEDAIRVCIGDPRIGSKVRAVQRELGTADVEEVIRVYRHRYPNDELGADRAQAALRTPTFTAPVTMPNSDLAEHADDVAGWS